MIKPLISATLLYLSITTACYAVIDPTSETQQLPTRISHTLRIPPNTDSVSQPAKQSNQWLSHTIRSGENLSIIFSKFGLSKNTLHQIISSNRLAKELKAIHPGQKIKILKNNKGELTALLLEQNAVESIMVSQTASGYTAEKIAKKIVRQIAYGHGLIENSLFLDAKKAGLSTKLTMQLASIFAWDIDFALDLRTGDQFTVIYEQLLLNGEEFDTGDILAVEFENRGTTYQAVRYISADGHSGHFTPDGKSLRKAFLRSPVEFARISSRFNLRRRHPILNKIRAHKGVDYAASRGTPVRATGDGKIVFRGRKGGYGRTVVVQHGQKYSTLYAHLSRFNRKRKKGTRIKQGQIIGYVGSSGLATGPHLHYEFRVYGAHKNPLTVKLPPSTPIKKKYFADFKASTQPLLSQLEKIKTVLVAQSE